jgi:hypothetical protein
VRLKPDERKAIALFAYGLSYEEIGEREGWTHTKVNRFLSEGRQRLRELLANAAHAEEGVGGLEVGRGGRVAGALAAAPHRRRASGSVAWVVLLTPWFSVTGRGCIRSTQMRTPGRSSVHPG